MAHLELPVELQKKLEEEDKKTQTQIAKHMREVKLRARSTKRAVTLRQNKKSINQREMLAK